MKRKIFAFLLFALAPATHAYLSPLYPGEGGGGGPVSWGSILGSIPDQVDLQGQLDDKVPFDYFPEFNPDNGSGGQSALTSGFSFRPLQNSPDESWTIFNNRVGLDPDSSGFTLGTAGNFANLYALGFDHQGTSDVGALTYFNTYSNIGNGTDPITMNGFSLFFGFGNINDNVTIAGPIQGYGFQLNVADGAAMNSYVNAFYDYSTWDTASAGHRSYAAGPQIEAIKNDGNYVAFDNNAQITTFQGNSNYTGLAVSAQVGTFGTGSFSGVNVNPTVAGVDHYYGVYATADNVTSPDKWAGYFDGDVNVTGSLSFGGALSIGRLNAYGEYVLADGGGNPGSVHALITQITNPANAVIANADTIGVNTAALITLGENSSYTSGPFGLGISALALPAVIETHTGSYGDAIGGATYALNFAGSSTGGTVHQVWGGRFLPIPNGITTVDRYYGVWSHALFGDLATANWAGYFEDALVYMEEGLKVGGGDTLSSADYGVESVKTIASDNGFQLNTSGTQPTCDAAHRGLTWNLEGGTGVADIFQVCQKTAADIYLWITH